MGLTEHLQACEQGDLDCLEREVLALREALDAVSYDEPRACPPDAECTGPPEGSTASAAVQRIRNRVIAISAMVHEILDRLDV